MRERFQYERNGSRESAKKWVFLVEEEAAKRSTLSFFSWSGSGGPAVCWTGHLTRAWLWSPSILLDPSMDPPTLGLYVVQTPFAPIYIWLTLNLVQKKGIKRTPCTAKGSV